MVFSVPRSDLEADHLGHDEGAEAHPYKPAEPGDDQPFIDERLIVTGLGGLVWMSIGAFIMAKMVSFEI